MNLSRIVLGLLLIVGAGGALAGGTGAFFSDTESSLGNTFTAGAIDVLVDNESYSTNVDGVFVFDSTLSWEPSNLNDGITTLHKFFDFGDLKPDDEGEDTISLHVDNDAFACMDVTLTSNDDNDTSEPEDLVDPTANPDTEWDGELAQAIQMFWWADDGDNVFETGENSISNNVQTLFALATTSPFSVALADSLGSIWPDNGPIPANEPRYIGKMWCFGTLAETPIAQDGIGQTGTGNGDSTNGPLVRGTGFSCDGTGLGNEAQTDEATLDVAFRAIQARNNDAFQCVPDVRRACNPGEEFADSFGTFDQGRTKVGALIVANRSDPNAALGAPQTTGTPTDAGFPAGSFASLGFGVATTAARTLVLNFDNNHVVDGAGADLLIYEVTGGVYPDEHIKVEASQDGIVWTVIAADVIRDASIDLNGSGLAWAAFIRVTDLNNPALFSDSVADGYDIDAIKAINCDAPVI